MTKSQLSSESPTKDSNLVYLIDRCIRSITDQRYVIERSLAVYESSPVDLTPDDKREVCRLSDKRAKALRVVGDLQTERSRAVVRESDRSNYERIMRRAVSSVGEISQMFDLTRAEITTLHARRRFRGSLHAELVQVLQSILREADTVFSDRYSSIAKLSDRFDAVFEDYTRTYHDCKDSSHCRELIFETSRIKSEVVKYLADYGEALRNHRASVTEERVAYDNFKQRYSLK